MVSLDDMRVFAELARTGSFTAAAGTLGVTKQTVSRRIHALETALGVELVRRTTRSVHLTDLGRAYAERCTTVLRLADEANAAMSAHTRAVRGTVRVSADHTVGELFLRNIVASFLAEWPDVELAVLLTPRKVDLLADGIDVAIRVGAPPSVHHLAARRLLPARLWTVASPAYLARRGTPETVEDLDQHDCLAALPDLGRAAWPMRVDGGMRLVPIQARLRANDVPTVRAAAVAGLGLAHLPAISVQADLDEGRLVQVLADHAVEAGGIHVVYPHASLLAPRVRAFVDHVSGWFSDYANTASYSASPWSASKQRSSRQA